MFESIFSTTTTSTSISIGSALLTILVSFVLGGLISFTYMKTSTRGSYSQNFSLTLVIVPTVVAIIVLLIGSNIARAFSLAGTFSLIKFRSQPGDPKDISFILFTMAAGLAAGTGFFGYALIFTLFLCLLMFALNFMNFGKNRASQKLLKITIPEDLNFEGAFDDIFELFTTNHELIKVKTTDLGSLYQIVYIVTMNNTVSQKDFLDSLRCRNGNLNITLSILTEKNDY